MILQIIEWYLRRRGKCVFPFCSGKIDFVMEDRERLYIVDIGGPVTNKIVASYKSKVLVEGIMRERRVLTTGNFKEMPTIVCLCGSTRFHDQFKEANYRETMAGRIVLSVGFAHESKVHGEDVGCTADEKIRLDELHKRKIDLADEVLVLNVGGYVGKSTQSEIDYAKSLGKPLRWLEVDCNCQIHIRYEPLVDRIQKHLGSCKFA